MIKLNITAKVCDAKRVDIYFFTEQYRKFRILREKQPDFRFTVCDNEKRPQSAEVIFDGTPEKTADFYHFADDNVEINSLYYYWLEVLDCNGEDRLSHPVTVTVRDQRVWWSREKVDSFLDDLKKDFPDKVRIIKCGKTTRGYDLRYVSVGNEDRKIGYVGTVHVSESGPEIILPAIRRMLEEDRTAFDKIGITMLPSVGADCREDAIAGVSKYIRTNPNGVDINRNFPAKWDVVSTMYGLSTDFPLDVVYRGPFPASESETQAVMKFVNDEKPDIVFSCHWLASVCENRCLCSQFCDSETEEKIKGYAMAYTLGFEKLMKYKFSADFYLKKACTGGSLPSYCNSIGILCVDIEGGVNKEFSVAEKGLVTYEMLELNSKCHENAIKSVQEYIVSIK